MDHYNTIIMLIKLTDKKP